MQQKMWTRDNGVTWCWPDFSERELQCKGTGKLVLNIDSMNKLQAMRDYVYERDSMGLRIKSAYRSREYNATVPGAAENSFHIHRYGGGAFDVAIDDHSPELLEEAAKHVGFTGFGYYDSFGHFDTGPARVWGNRDRFLKRNSDGHREEQKRSGGDVGILKDPENRKLIGSAAALTPPILNGIAGLGLPWYVTAVPFLIACALIGYVIWRKVK